MERQCKRCLQLERERDKLTEELESWRREAIEASRWIDPPLADLKEARETVRWVLHRSLIQKNHEVRDVLEQIGRAITALSASDPANCALLRKRIVELERRD